MTLPPSPLLPSPLLRSPLLDEHGFAHGFSLRTGGVSEGPFASLNLARTIGDDPEHVAENARRFARAVGVETLYEVSQVHGARVVEAGPRSEVMALRTEEADALIARASGQAVAVRTADCVPILIGDPRTGAVAAVHAGWRGVVARIVGATVAKLAADPRDLVAAIGPHIRLERFEVGEEVAAALAEVAHGEDVVQRGAGNPHVDLARTLRAQLHALGLTRVDDVGGCTHAEADRFFSHRRDRGVTGRHLSAILSR